MIGRISGRLIQIEQTMALVEAFGVGYEIECPVSTLCELTAGSEIALWTHMVVREDAQLLFGFKSRDDRSCFRTLIRVSGVGPKLAIGILSGLSANELIRAVDQGDVNTLVRVPGVGRKTAERLLVELRDRLGSGVDHSLTSTTSPSEDAILGLVSLGYKESEARKVLATLDTTNATPEQLIRQALKALLGTS